MLKEIEIPTTCPSCSSELDVVNYQLFCRNDECSAQKAKAVEHFSKTLKIKGLGPATISKLDLQNIEDIYSLNENDLVLGIGEALGNKLFQQIEQSKNISLNKLLPAFGIPLIGNTATQKICKVISHIDDLCEQTCTEAGLGPKATENLMNWKETLLPLYKTLPFSFKAEKVQENTNSKGVVCISGKLSSFKTKAEAQKELESLGFIVKSSVTKDVTILVNESGVESAKTKKARESGLTIVNNLQDFIKEQL